MQAYEIHPRHTSHNAAFVNRLPVCAEDGEVDPREARMVTRAPDHILYVEGAIILQMGLSISHSNDPGHAHDPGVDQIFGLDPHQRSRVRDQFGP